MKNRMRRGLVVAAMLVAFASAVQGRASAHEMGNSRARISVAGDGALTVDVMVDPQALLARLALEGGEPAPPADDHPAIAAAIERQLGTLAEGFDLRVDGARVPVRLDYEASVPASLAAGAPLGQSGETGTLRATGPVPGPSATFTFAYRWTYGAMAVTVADARGGVDRLLWLGPGEASQAMAIVDVRPASRGTIAAEYLWLGFTHILPKGLDHILFVLGLFFLSAGWRPLLLQVTTFTAAHTLTLGLSMIGAVSLSPAIVEPLIALSIAYVAIENLVTSELRRSRLLLVFGFGLLHGLGFAGVLAGLGVPSSQFLPALVSFNVGVEAGQLVVIGLATCAVAGWRQRDASLLPLVARPASVAIALSGLYWTVTRL